LLQEPPGFSRGEYQVYQDLDRLLGAIERALSNRKDRPPYRDQRFEDAAPPFNNMAELRDYVWKAILSLLNRAERHDDAPGSDAFFDRVKEYIGLNLAEPISLQSLCEAMGISQSYMSRIFRRRTALSFNDYLTEQRIGRAKYLIKEMPELPLKAVAELVGYKDPNYFSKVFRGAVGVPPSQFS
jgi:YesN/AraC family two-component response regulator